MSRANQPRRPAGTPQGGQWAPGAHAESDLSLEDSSTDLWRQAGFSRAEMRMWQALSEMTLGEVRLWSKRFLAFEAAKWKAARFDVHEAAEWSDAGFGPQPREQRSAVDWRDAGFLPQDASAWAASGYEASEAREWRDAGFGTLTAAPWANAGVSPQNAKPGIAPVELESDD